MQSQIKWFLIFVFILTSPINEAFSQDLNIEVTVEASLLPPDAQEKLSHFKQRVEEYLNKNKWHSDKIPPINGQMQFNFTGINTTTFYYEAKVFVASTREIFNPFKTGPPKYSVAFRFLDERLDFFYNDNMPFIKNENRFESLLSILDYYANIIVGYDEDSYWPKGGNKYFQKALDICNKVPGYINGWNETGGGSKPSRLQLVQELLNTRFDNFRKAYFEYNWMGLDSMAIRKVNGFNNILIALEVIGNIKKKEVKAYNIDVFFDSKANEIADLFLDYGDRRIYDKLSQIDPAHITIYTEAKSRAR